MTLRTLNGLEIYSVLDVLVKGSYIPCKKIVFYVNIQSIVINLFPVVQVRKIDIRMRLLFVMSQRNWWQEKSDLYKIDMPEALVEK